MENLNDITVTLAQQVRARRVALHLSQREAAAALGVSERTFQNWESGSSFPWPKHRRVLEVFLNGDGASA